MNLELLPNELFFDLFEYLNAVHLFIAFHGLNSRINELFFTPLRLNLLDFRSVSKHDFDVVCQQHLPSVADQIHLLSLSNGDETPNQTECFLSHHLTLRQFPYLQSLSLSYIRSPQIMDTMLNDLSALFHHLQRLNVIDCFFTDAYLDIIWKQPKLTHCNLNNIECTFSVSALTSISSSIENIIIAGTENEKGFLGNLLNFTPKLKRLSISLFDDNLDQNLESTYPLLEELMLSLRSSTDVLTKLLERMPNLTALTVITKRSYVDGYQWETMINKYLPKLNKFRLIMQFRIDDDDVYNEDKIDQILNTFQTHFWTKRHWFVRCHWDPYFESGYCCLYTLPYTLNIFLPETHMKFKSTCRHESKHNFYNCVNTLIYGPELSTDFCRLHFSNIHELRLKLPCDDNVRSVIPTLHRLKVLSVQTSNNINERMQLQALLDRAPRLFALELVTLTSTSHVLPNDLTSKSISQLDLRFNGLVFNDETCRELCNSPLGIQCKILFIRVENRTNILYIVNHMQNLRALHAECGDESGSDMSGEYQHIEFLRQNLPSSCIISSDEDFPNNIQLWIR